MIENIRISNIASYDASGINIVDLKKINFFYGANGCGKTTISNYLANTNTNNQESGQCMTTWKSGRPLKTLVYNKQFRDDNFGTGTVAGIFTLGQATNEDIANINNKKQKVNELRNSQSGQKETLIAQQGKLKAYEDSFTSDCWAMYKQHESTLKEALYGHINSKPKFSQKILEEKTSNSSDLLTFEALQTKATTLFGEPPIRIDTIPSIEVKAALQKIEQDAIWQKIIIGKADVDIASLITKLENSDWVNQGRAFIADDDICPFCQQTTINGAFKSKIEEYFDEGFNSDKSKLLDQQAAYANLIEPILSTLDQIEVTEKTNTETHLEIENFTAHLKAIHSQVSENKLLIREKIEKASQQISLTQTKEELEAISTIIEQANETITKHNLLVVNYNSEVSALKNEVWRYLVDALSPKIDDYKSATDGLQCGIDSISAQIEARKESIQACDQEIIDLSKNVTSVQPTVDEINRLLAAYGFTNFLIVPSPEQENHYAIQRENGELALQTLSEGEVTFITFLYFVQLANGSLNENSVSEDRVVVIDDPISSLDSNVLYLVSTIVKDLIRRTKEGLSSIKQLFLLTHNVYFHKEASFVGGRSNGDKDTHFWIIRKNRNLSSIQAHRQNNPIESSYELLWREIKEWERNSGITLQNTMRRIIENYFKILGGFSDDGLVDRFETLEEQQTCRSLISWINDGSHTIPDDLYVQTPDDSAERYLPVFEKVFKYTNNHGHYQMMMGQNAQTES